MSERNEWLLRGWGGDIEQVVALRKPDKWEREDHAACWWFPTKDDRERFIKSFHNVLNVVRDRVDPGPNCFGEVIDTHMQTIAKVTLETPDGQISTFEMSFGYGYPEHSAHYMFEEGNYSCDCNRRNFLREYCGIDGDEVDDCGDTIKLVKIEMKHVE